jgi:hypothetical protein
MRTGFVARFLQWAALLTDRRAGRRRSPYRCRSPGCRSGTAFRTIARRQAPLLRLARRGRNRCSDWVHPSGKSRPLRARGLAPRVACLKLMALRRFGGFGFVRRWPTRFAPCWTGYSSGTVYRSSLAEKLRSRLILAVPWFHWMASVRTMERRPMQCQVSARKRLRLVETSCLPPRLVPLGEGAAAAPRSLPMRNPGPQPAEVCCLDAPVVRGLRPRGTDLTGDPTAVQSVGRSGGGERQNRHDFALG